MRKLFCIVLASCVLLCLWGCKKKIEPKTFEFSGLEITLTNEFKEKDSGYLMLYTDGFKVTIVPSPVSSINNQDIGEYAQMVAEGLEDLKDFFYGFSDEIDTFVCEYTLDIDGINDRSIVAVYKNAEYYYNVTFTCAVENYEGHKSQFIEWLKTVRVT